MESNTPNLETQLLEIEADSLTMLEQANRSIIACTNLLGKLKKEIMNNGFQSTSDEIHFFKHTKHIPLKHLIYFTEIRSFEIQFPKAGICLQRKYIERKISKINRFFSHNLDFSLYTDSKYTHFDEHYYTREPLDLYQIPTSKIYFQDPEFFTPRNILLGKFVAFNSLVTYLEKRLYKLENTIYLNQAPYAKVEKLIWPFTNTDWVELIYAFHAAGLAKQNNLSISMVSQAMQEVFDYVPKDLYKIFQNIKNRKGSKTLFLDNLTASLLLAINKSEE